VSVSSQNIHHDTILIVPYIKLQLSLSNHLDKNRENNRVDNLEWATVLENNQHKVTHNPTRKKVDCRPVWKCDKETRTRIQLFPSYKVAAHSIDPNNIVNIESNIRGALANNKLSAYGFFWEYEDYPVIEGETWAEIPPEAINGTEGYEVSSEGRLRQVSTGKMFAGYNDEANYIRVSINEVLYRMHQLVASAFIPNPEDKPHVNHKDGVRNNNKLSNLEWVTRAENMQHAYDTGLNTNKKS
jgi:HNH endonuclease